MQTPAQSPLWKTYLLFLAPMVLSNFLQSMSGTINSIYIGQMLGTQALAAGQLDARVDIRTGDEFSNLGGAFNTMAASLERDDMLALADYFSKQKQAPSGFKADPAKAAPASPR